MNKVKKQDEIYFPECGKAIKRQAVMCPFCGVQVKNLFTKTDIVTEPETTLKKKGVAILFLSDILF